jgi:hypothetical protein
MSAMRKSTYILQKKRQEQLAGDSCKEIEQQEEKVLAERMAERGAAESDTSRTFKKAIKSKQKRRDQEYEPRGKGERES